MVDIKFGPAGIGSVKEAAENLERFYDMGLRACEIPFTYAVFIKKDKHMKEIEEIRKNAKKFGIRLSIHAPYWINLNSDDAEKIVGSKKRILDSAEIMDLLGGGRVVFHCGFYGGDKSSAYENIKMRILEMMDFIKEKKWDVELCPETMGKKNVFGGVEEISKLVNETGCGFCIDFAHILARYGKYEFDLVEKSFPQKKWHCHFSGIEYGEKGEKKHIRTEKKDWLAIFEFLKNIDKNVVIINEADDPLGESLEGLWLWGDL